MIRPPIVDLRRYTYCAEWHAVVGSDSVRASGDASSPRAAVRRARLAWWAKVLRQRRDARQLRRMGRA